MYVNKKCYLFVNHMCVCVCVAWGERTLRGQTMPPIHSMVLTCKQVRKTPRIANTHNSTEYNSEAVLIQFTNQFKKKKASWLVSTAQRTLLYKFKQECKNIKMYNNLCTKKTKQFEKQYQKRKDKAPQWTSLLVGFTESPLAYSHTLSLLGK